MQAARGASLNSEDPDPSGTGTSTQEPVTGAVGPRRLLLLGVVAVTAYALDQVTKQLAASHLAGEAEIGRAHV